MQLPYAHLLQPARAEVAQPGLVTVLRLLVYSLDPGEFTGCSRCLATSTFLTLLR
jgi:hypothetical protein